MEPKIGGASSLGTSVITCGESGTGNLDTEELLLIGNLLLAAIEGVVDSGSERGDAGDGGELDSTLDTPGMGG